MLLDVWKWGGFRAGSDHDPDDPEEECRKMLNIGAYWMVDIVDVAKFH